MNPAVKASTRAIRQNPVTVIGSDGQPRSSYMKLAFLRALYGDDGSKYNRTGFFAPDLAVQEGDLVQQAGETYIVGNLSPDVHRGQIIRFSAELLWCSHLAVTAFRPTVVRHPTSGAITGVTSTLVASGLSLLLATHDVSLRGARDVDVGQWNAYVSRHSTLLQAEDYLLIEGVQYEVKFHRVDFQGAWTYRVMKATR